MHYASNGLTFLQKSIRQNLLSFPSNNKDIGRRKKGKEDSVWWINVGMLGLNFAGTQHWNEQRCRVGDQQELCTTGIKKPLTLESNHSLVGLCCFCCAIYRSFWHICVPDVREIFDLFDFWDGRDGEVDAAKIGDVLRCAGLNPTNESVMKNGGCEKFGLYKICLGARNFVWSLQKWIWKSFYHIKRDLATFSWKAAWIERYGASSSNLCGKGGGWHVYTEKPTHFNKMCE